MRRVRPSILIVVLLAVTGIIAFCAVGIGSQYVSPGETISILRGSNSEYAYIVNHFRIPRVILALLAGAGLAVSGVILQSILRNPLASPDVIGITKGAGLAAVSVIVFLPNSPIFILPVSAFVGAALVAVVLMVFTHKSGAKSSTLALVGIALGAICQAATEFILIKFPVNANVMLLWLAGSLWGRGWDQLYGLLPWFILLIPIVIGMSLKLDVLHFGDDIATGLGVKSNRARYILLSIAVALAGLCVATVGSVGFVGLIAPHMAKRIVGPKHKYSLPVAALCGGLLLVIADSIGRGLAPPIEIPVGILTAIIGVPYFIYLLRFEQKRK
ncbi:iron-dicitrate transporter subunit FecD [Paenibacillus sp. BIHB 4019]|uniref:Iron-dicitrate transporter subunit FecD n=1 Tax=Paenibacillus sp. BIHB 4019 TaxID=1870819 RepID=A0A1B2DIU4_9BACL|nr:iron chelate uptake ABC transporter family permease subunit [Paenibacillus sp. BIHB 4019]ANY67644.1 iron-dicitrate transporter subunit FecD [Paenibacillus sp. BIHB 4019]